MRKFVIKNRQKRKYTKKTKDTSSFSFSKTAYGMVPLLVMLIAFMSTITISNPFRDSLSNINFIFELPQFSFSNPLSFIQSIISDITQASFVGWTILLAMYTTFLQSLSVFSKALTHELLALENIVEFQKNAAQNTITYNVQEFATGVSMLEQIMIMITTVVTHFAYFIGQNLSALAIATVQTISLISSYLSHIILFTSITIFNFIFMIGETIGIWLVSIDNYIVHVIEIPFKVLYAFWLQIKPYVDFFGKHVQMTGSDFANGFTSFGKVISFVSHAK